MTIIKEKIAKALAPTLVITAIFFVTLYFFGMENTMIGPFATLSFLRYRSMCNHYECMLKNFAIYIIMAVLAYFAVLSFGLCILLNALALFWIAYFLIDEYNPTNYFPAGMALIFFQIAPVHTPHALLLRIGALIATFVIVFLFVFVLTHLQKKEHLLLQLLQSGFDNCKKQLDACASGKEQELDALHHELCDINKKCSGEIYSYNRASIRMKGKTNWYCRFIIAFQVINYLTLNYRQEDNLVKAEKLYTDFYNLFQNYEPKADYKRLRFRDNRPDIHNFRFRFALRQVITLTPCLLYAYISDAQNVYWLVISVFFMMIPYSEHTVQRVKQRVAGTIGGIVLCFVLFSVFQSFPARVVIMTIANFFIYGANGYTPTVVYITCSALALQTLNDTISIVLLQRLIYTLVGAGIALFANRFIFSIHSKKQIYYMKELLRKICGELAELTRSMSPGSEERRRQIDQRIIKSYLLSKRLETLHNTLPPQERDMDYISFEKEHMTFLASFLSKELI